MLGHLRHVSRYRSDGSARMDSVLAVYQQCDQHKHFRPERYRRAVHRHIDRYSSSVGIQWIFRQPGQSVVRTPAMWVTLSLWHQNVHSSISIHHEGFGPT